MPAIVFPSSVHQLVGASVTFFEAHLQNANVDLELSNSSSSVPGIFLSNQSARLDTSLHQVDEVSWNLQRGILRLCNMFCHHFKLTDRHSVFRLLSFASRIRRRRHRGLLLSSGRIACKFACAALKLRGSPILTWCISLQSFWIRRTLVATHLSRLRQPRSNLLRVDLYTACTS